jgi:AraC family transcriptional regulator, regulatory protein of adaptative response / DNA-3-methyladenine glycosylase II
VPLHADAVELMLEYRPPLHTSSLLAWLAARATAGAELVEGRSYAATVRVTRRLQGERPQPSGAIGRPAAMTEEVTGHVELTLPGDDEAAAPPHPQDRASESRGRHAVRVRLSPSLVPVLMPLLQRLRDLLDLDANPAVIAQHLARAGALPAADALAGVRIPGTLDGFSLAVRAILGQQVSVRGATTVMGRLVDRFGDPYAGGHPALTRLMPTAERLASLRTGDLATLGMPGAGADAVLAPGADAARSIRALTALPGIGDWTAHYIAMRALRWPDAFPANDLVLRRAAGNLTAAQLVRLAEPWRPWRAYAAMHLWRTATPAPATRS